MKEHKNKKIISIITIIVLIGIIVISTVGFKVSLKYHENKKIEISMSKKFELNDIEKISKEVIGKKVIAQKVEIYEDAVKIVAEDITEEQKNEIINKINEKYEVNIDKESVKIQEVPHARLRDLIKPYITPFIIMTIVVLIYMVLRYYKLNSLMVFLKTLLDIVVGQALLFSLFAILRIEIGIITIPLVIVTYILSIMYCTQNCEKKLEEIVKEEE